jgi:predicted DNA-binding transcriptional regulator YafY
MTKQTHQTLEEQRKRRLFIDRELFWQGCVTRAAIIKAFGVSSDTAREDLGAYKDLHAKDLRTNPVTRIYEAPDGFKQRMEETNAEEYLNWLAGGAMFHLPSPSEDSRKDWLDRIDTVPELERKNMEPICLQGILRAMRDGKEIEISYKSPHDSEPKNFWIYPHAFCNDTFRWSCRCWRYDHERWGEIVLDRIEKVFYFDGENDLRRNPPADKVEKDHEWNSKIEVVLVPHPGLSKAAKEAIERQYEMKNGELSVSLRRSQVVYFLKRYQLEEPESQSRKAPHQQPLVVKNRKEITEGIPKRMRIPPEA